MLLRRPTGSTGVVQARLRCRCAPTYGSVARARPSRRPRGQGIVMPPRGRRSKRRRELRTPQPGDRLWIPGSDPKGFRPAMEGTSGAAYRAPFREGVREAALERRARASDLVGSAIRRLVRRFAGGLVAGASKSTSRPTPSAKLQPSVSRARDTGCPGRCWVGAKPSLASDRFEGRHADGETSSCAAPGPIPPGWPRTAARRSGATRDQKLLTWATRRAVRGVRTVRGRARRSSRIAEVDERRVARTSPA